MTDSLFSVEDTVVLVSGASRGIGRALAAGFAERGARVIVTGREEATLTATAREITAGKAVSPVVCDVSDARAVNACVETVVAEHGHIDTLINVAGVNVRQPAERYSGEQYDFIFDINLKGAFQMSQEVGRRMIERGSGSQINIDSLNTYAPLKRVVPYAMSKAGMSMMTRGLALEWGPHGVRVNGIAPGFILTDLTAKLWSQPHMQTWVREFTPLRRLGAGEDLVSTALYLAAPGAAFLTGQTIRVDGGVSAGIDWPIDGP